MHFDHIEIGTSDFRTLIKSAPGNGIAVEPVVPYFKNLPEREKWYRVNAAIGTDRGMVKVFYTDPDLITDEPNWVRGCNSIGKPHPTIKEKFPHLIREAEVNSITIRDLFEMFNVSTVGHLKIDTEGMDCKILMDYFKEGLPHAQMITFETNQLTDQDELKELLEIIHQFYNTYPIEFNTICKLK